MTPSITAVAPCSPLLPLGPAKVVSLAVVAVVAAAMGYLLTWELQAVGYSTTSVVMMLAIAVVVRSVCSLKKHHNSVGQECSIMNKVCVFVCM